jgi:hypothetical protein
MTLEHLQQLPRIFLPKSCFWGHPKNIGGVKKCRPPTVLRNLSQERFKTEICCLREWIGVPCCGPFIARDRMAGSSLEGPGGQDVCPQGKKLHRFVTCSRIHVRQARHEQIEGG